MCLPYAHLHILSHHIQLDPAVVVTVSLSPSQLPTGFPLEVKAELKCNFSISVFPVAGYSSTKKDSVAYKIEPWF